MKRAVNLRLEENVIVTLNQLADELKTTKTEIVESAIEFFSRKNGKNKSNLLQYAGKLNKSESDKMLFAIKESKNTKDFSLEIE